MKLLQETIDKESSLPNQQEKTTAPEKQSVVSQKQSVVYTSLQITKLNLKSLRIERMHTDVYNGSLQTQSYIQSSQKPLRNSIKQSTLDHLQHNQESDLDPLKTHTSFGQHTNTKNADLDPLKNTQHFSANTQTNLFYKIQGLHLL